MEYSAVDRSPFFLKYFLVFQKRVDEPTFLNPSLNFWILEVFSEYFTLHILHRSNLFYRDSMYWKVYPKTWGKIHSDTVYSLSFWNDFFFWCITFIHLQRCFYWFLFNILKFGPKIWRKNSLLITDWHFARRDYFVGPHQN